MKKILVTGASGFLGNHVVAELQALDFDVHVLSRRPYSAGAGVSVHTCDLLNQGMEQLVELFSGIQPSHLLHLAWCVEPGEFWTTPENLQWVDASLNLYRAFVMARGKRAVCAGTCAEYDWSSLEAEALLHEEHSPKIPSTLYGQSKLSVQETLEKASELDELSFAWGRLFFLYGPGEKRGRLISDAIVSLLNGEVFEATAATQIRDFIYVVDAAQAFAKLCDSGVEGPVNIASGKARRIEELLREVERQTGTTDLLRIGARPMHTHEAPALVADVTRLREEVGISEATSLEEGVRATVTWWKNNV